ncbi:PEPxxWA-CTERM sorting domain-containing protein [Rhizorhabdus argentea]|uniref:PEPxxWA-CTERM sorting domain-containing protein n=1 Tax=Rhizorhabdus argentea TaxID=1387174 RepID=UPI0030EE5BFE
MKLGEMMSHSADRLRRPPNSRGRLVSAMLGLLGVAAAAGVGATPAYATYDLTQFVTNGGFEQTSKGLGQIGYATQAIGWTSHPWDVGYAHGTNSYNYIMNATTATSIGSPADFGTIWLAGPGNGFANSQAGTGGNFFAGDGQYHVGQLTQTISGLIIGQSYTLTFDYAGAQVRGYNAVTTHAWDFGLANEGLNSVTQTLTNGSGGFTGWYTATFDFVASQASDTLYFMAAGTPAGQPPMSLLDNVSLIGPVVSAAPEPATWMTMLIGFGIIGFIMRARRPGLLRQPSESAFSRLD